MSGERKKFNPPSNGHLRLTHAEVQLLIEARLPGREMWLLLAILDETRGWQRDTVTRRLGYWSLRTGIGKSHLPGVFRSLERKGFIEWMHGVQKRRRQQARNGTIRLVCFPAKAPSKAHGNGPAEGTDTSPGSGTDNGPVGGTDTRSRQRDHISRTLKQEGQEVMDQSIPLLKSGGLTAAPGIPRRESKSEGDDEEERIEE